MTEPICTISPQIRSREDLAQLTGSPFSPGNTPSADDYDDLFASLFFPKEDDSARIAVDAATKALWLSHFPDLPLTEQRLFLNSLLNRFLVYTLARLDAPLYAELGVAEFLTANSLKVSGDQTETARAGRRVRATQNGAQVYGRVTLAGYDSGTGKTTLTLAMNAGHSLTSELDTAAVSLVDWDAAPPDEAATSAQILAALGYTPANRAGDTFTGTVNAPKFVARNGAPYGKLSITATPPGTTDGENGDIWFVY